MSPVQSSELPPDVFVFVVHSHMKKHELHLESLDIFVYAYKSSHRYQNYFQLWYNYKIYSFIEHALMSYGALNIVFLTTTCILKSESSCGLILYLPALFLGES